MSIFLKGNKYSLGFRPSIETKLKQSEAQRLEKHWKWKGGKPKCTVCNKQLSKYKAKHCKVHRPITLETRLKRSIATKGEKSHAWRGGITPKNKAIRNSLEYREWVKKVFGRDKYTCVFCGKVGGDMHADHIKQFAYHPEVRFDINNGRTLCVSCHRKTDTYAKKASLFSGKIGI